MHQKEKTRNASNPKLTAMVFLFSVCEPFIAHNRTKSVMLSNQQRSLSSASNEKQKSCARATLRTRKEHSCLNTDRKNTHGNFSFWQHVLETGVEVGTKERVVQSRNRAKVSSAGQERESCETHHEIAAGSKQPERKRKLKMKTFLLIFCCIATCFAFQR